MRSCPAHLPLVVSLADPVDARLAAAEETNLPSRALRPEVVDIPGEPVPDPAAYLAPFIRHLEEKGRWVSVVTRAHPRSRPCRPGPG